MEPKIDVLLYGVGAIGSFYAFILNRSPSVRLTLVARSNYEAVKANGITLDSEIHGKHTFRPYNVVSNPVDAAGHYHYVVCVNKAINQDAVAKSLAPVVDDTTAIVLIQNGVGNEDPFRAQFPKCSILSCVTWVGATQTSPGIVTHIKSENTEIGLFPNPSLPRVLELGRLDSFTYLLKAGNTKFVVEENIQIRRWEKVVWNVAWNAITALTMIDTKTWLHSSPDAIPLTKKLMHEVIEVARKSGVPMRDELVDELFTKIMALPGVYTSMQKDVAAKNPLEIEVILGVPVKKARELGVDIPVLEVIHTLVAAVDYGLREGKMFK
ncbi:2-dehydropantoate 2-reductase [Hyaloscypha hepaticicola]|uniref:2-dehydropantoate 2-reductase n=1 Tax=Hyaloscypha hepaticicola TaxID=2082293 RepID=A0A2J6Q5P8_9HELO|nr:2-dehydropantoate 2-reductase [Hyaloscypha hepaticicola]